MWLLQRKKKAELSAEERWFSLLVRLSDPFWDRQVTKLYEPPSETLLMVVYWLNNPTG